MKEENTAVYMVRKTTALFKKPSSYDRNFFETAVFCLSQKNQGEDFIDLKNAHEFTEGRFFVTKNPVQFKYLPGVWVIYKLILPKNKIELLKISQGVNCIKVDENRISLKNIEGVYSPFILPKDMFIKNPAFEKEIKVSPACFFNNKTPKTNPNDDQLTSDCTIL